MLKSRKGISPILATLLLIVIAVAAISITYAWIMTYTESATDKAGVMLYQANVFYNSTDTNNLSITVDIGNSGTSDDVVNAIYFGASESSMSSQTITPAPVSAGGAPVSFTFDYPWAASTTYYFRVVPSMGNPLTFHVDSP
ncbi:MAG: hypothetical protein NWF05_11690 [Candidatus Bathyarchaeota archaeon]|nr:hypothetical protein [Candidatus Bathyarchaeota archaeon]